MDVREMTDKVKRGEPLYGKSTLTPYMQGVASRNSRYSGVWLHILPWFNFANHDQVNPHSVYLSYLDRVLDWLNCPSMGLIPLNTTNKQKGNSPQNKQSKPEADSSSPFNHLIMFALNPWE